MTSLTAQTVAQVTSFTAQISEMVKIDSITQSMLDTVDMSRIMERRFVPPPPVLDFSFGPRVRRQRRRLPERSIVRKEVTRRVGFEEFEK